MYIYMLFWSNARPIVTYFYITYFDYCDLYTLLLQQHAGQIRHSSAPGLQFRTWYRSLQDTMLTNMAERQDFPCCVMRFGPSPLILFCFCGTGGDWPCWVCACSRAREHAEWRNRGANAEALPAACLPTWSTMDCDGLRWHIIHSNSIPRLFSTPH